MLSWHIELCPQGNWELVHMKAPQFSASSVTTIGITSKIWKVLCLPWMGLTLQFNWLFKFSSCRSVSQQLRIVLRAPTTPLHMHPKCLFFKRIKGSQDIKILSITCKITLAYLNCTSTSSWQNLEHWNCKQRSFSFSKFFNSSMLQNKMMASGLYVASLILNQIGT